SGSGGVGGTVDTCMDGTQDGNETGSDCGGPDCVVKCEPGVGCNEASDCSGGCCSNGLCCYPYAGGTGDCSNPCKAGDETDVDCGGSCGPTCGQGSGCSVIGDCVPPFDCIGGTCT